MNKALLLGNAGKDPEIISFENGTRVAKFSLATTEFSKDKEGNKIENTTWHNIVAWGKLSEIIEKYVKKGSKILVEGRIVNRSWEDKEGTKRYTTEIVVSELTLLSAKQSEGKPQEEQPGSQEESKGDDDLPF